MKIEQGAAISLSLHNWNCISFCISFLSRARSLERKPMDVQSRCTICGSIHILHDQIFIFLPLQGFCNPNEQRSLVETYQGEKLWIDTFCSHGLIFICTCDWFRFWYDCGTVHYVSCLKSSHHVSRYWLFKDVQIRSTPRSILQNWQMMSE